MYGTINAYLRPIVCDEMSRDELSTRRIVCDESSATNCPATNSPSTAVVVAIVDVHQYIQSPFGIASIASTNNLPEQTIPKRDGTTLFKWYFDFSLNCLLIVPFHFNSELGPETSHYLWIDERFTSRTTCICDFGRKSRSWNNENNQTCSIWRTWWEITTARC